MMMAYTNNDNTLNRVSLAEFIKNQRPYKEVRYFVGESIYVSINKNSILLKNMEFSTNRRIISEAIISVDYDINRLTLFPTETDESIEFNFNGYIRW
jgi:hypothetical protein